MADARALAGVAVTVVTLLVTPSCEASADLGRAEVRVMDEVARPRSKPPAVLAAAPVTTTVRAELADPEPTTTTVGPTSTTAAPTTIEAPQASTTVAPPPPVLSSPGRFAWFYKPPANASAAELATRYDVIVLTRNDESFRDEVKAANPSIRVLQYVLANEIQDAGTQQPWRNQVAWNTGDAASLLVDHPDWFARDDAGQPIVEDIGGGRSVHVMDPGQPGWTDFLIDRALAHNIDAGWDGLFLDNLEMSLSKRQRTGDVPAGYPTDTAWRDAFVGHVAEISRAFAAAGRPVWANVIEGGESATDIGVLAPHLEGTMDESFGTGWDGVPRTGSSWERDLAAAEARTSHGDQSLLVAQGQRADESAMRYAYASYLLVAGPTVSFRFADHRAAYAESWWFDEFDRTLGEPLGPRYPSNGTWVRDFDGGRVTVNPSAGTASID